ncbi:MAG TPA: xanthine dehydrogenase family protein molybdopterin-binding subunit [Thermoleophilaceae bacterium]
MTLVGRALPRREDALVLEGRARYLDDIDPTGGAHATFVRSPFAHARVGAVVAPGDAPGLVAVLTAESLRGRVRPLPFQVPDGVTAADEPHPILADGEVRYAGQPVAALIAESRPLAEDAAELVEVDYEPLEPVVDARAPGVDLVEFRRSGGDVERAFASAAHVVRGTYAMPRLVAAPMEPRGAIASEEDGLLTVWCSTQDSHRAVAHLAHSLDRPPESIRVIVPQVGGAFGSKGGAPAEAVAVAAAAIELGRPVKWAEDRLENFLAAYQGRGMEADVELAFDGDGRMLAVRARIRADVGAYLLQATAVPPHTAGMLMCGCYRLDAAEVEVVGRRTNRVPTGPYRGAGRPEAAYFMERAVDDAARELGIDPVELRRRNLIAEFPHTTPLGFTYDSGDFARCLDRALELVRPERSDDGERAVGTGVGLYVERAGGRFESAVAALQPGGRVLVRGSTSPHGQGHDTTFAQVAADRLGLEIADVAFEFGDSAVVPPGIGTFGSRSVAVGGAAVAEASDRLREACLAAAARVLGAEVSWDGGALVAADGRRLTLAELAEAEPGIGAEARFDSDLVFASGAYAAVVEIERAAGRMRVLRLAAVDDAGTIINPLLAEGQVLGGVAQGLGECLSEAATFDDEGQPTAANFADYSLLTAAELPPIETAFVESASPLNPLGAKGIGEGGAIGTPPAVANAVADALGHGVDPPFTEDRLWRAMRT